VHATSSYSLSSGQAVSRSRVALHVRIQQDCPWADQARDHRSRLAAPAKRLLIRIAGRLPARIHSDHLTGLALNWFGDVLAAGTIALMGEPRVNVDPLGLWGACVGGVRC